MTMKGVQKNLASEMQAIATDLLKLKAHLNLAVTMYATEDMASLTDADYAELTEFVHVTSAEMTAAKNAMGEVNTALGDFVAGSAVTRMLRIVNVVPR